MKSLLTALLAIPEDSFTASNASSTAYHIVSLVFIILMFVAALTAVILVLLQPGNSLGGSSETFYGKNKGKSTEAILKRWTIVCLVALAVFAVIYFILQVPAIWGLNS